METIDFPSGTVTFQFTDIEGPRRLRKNCAGLLSDHHRIPREVFSSWLKHGVVE